MFSGHIERSFDKISGLFSLKSVKSPEIPKNAQYHSLHTYNAVLTTQTETNSLIRFSARLPTFCQFSQLTYSSRQFIDYFLKVLAIRRRTS